MWTYSRHLKAHEKPFCALMLPVTTASDIARIGYVTREQNIQSSLPQHYQYTLVQPWKLWVAPFQVADGTIGISMLRLSILVNYRVGIG